MKNRLTLSFFVVIILFAATNFAGANSRSGLVTIQIDLSGQEQGKEARLWVPYPVSDHDQVVSNIRTSGDYASIGVYTDTAHSTPILYAEWSEQARTRKLVFSFNVQRQEVIRRDFPAKQPDWNPADYAEFLKATSLGPIDGDVKVLADSITKGQQTVLEKAKAIYNWTCEHTYRIPETIGCGKGDVCELLKDPGGKCTDISSLFVALARAAGVPAREIFSIRLGKKSQEDITTWQHCWAEFFLPGYGWVPVDPADVRKAMLVEKLDLKDSKTKEYRDYFWGGIDPYRVVIAKGRDLILNPPQKGAPLNTFGYPYAEVGGKAVDFYMPSTFVYRISYKAQ
ncbi:MAG: transglutaminase [Desulfobacteraceae bacterium]|nr:MAG: transglutaminase [Desulfobacteraceae bacterium]